jgi:hypothetical protein
MSRYAVVVLVLGALSSSSTWALDRGDVCTLKAPLPMVVNRKQGRVEATIDRGVDVTVVTVGDEGRTRVTTGDATGSVATRDLEAACAGTLQVCKLTQPVTLYAKTRSDSQAWRLKTGGLVSVLRSGKVWAHVRVDDLEGFTDATDLRDHCVIDAGGSVSDAAEPELSEEIARGEGPGILWLPFIVEGAAPVDDVDAVGVLFYDRLAAYRPDAAPVPLNLPRTSKWKAYAEAARTRAKASGFAFAMIGKVEVADIEGKGTLVASIAIIDAKSGRVLKGVRIKPTTRFADLWPEIVLSALLPYAGSAPNSTPVVAPPEEPLPMLQTPPPPPRPLQIVEDAPWFANPWGYVTLVAAVGAGVGAGVVGSMAMEANDAANAAPPISDDRASLRRQALPLALGADGLAVVGVGMVVATVAVFASHAGMD